ncbi:MAG: TA0938 family protein [Candidatus Kariarchaeaceae archaeon]|jgi:hypothetical protein
MSESNSCELCGSEWGDYWYEIDEKSLFFCCEICAIQYRNMTKAIRKETNWHTIDHLEIEGTSRGRTGIALSNGENFNFRISFLPDGRILDFQNLSDLS